MAELVCTLGAALRIVALPDFRQKPPRPTSRSAATVDDADDADRDPHLMDLEAVRSTPAAIDSPTGSGRSATCSMPTAMASMRSGFRVSRSRKATDTVSRSIRHAFARAARKRWLASLRRRGAASFFAAVSTARRRAARRARLQISRTRPRRRRRGSRDHHVVAVDSSSQIL